MCRPPSKYVATSTGSTQTCWGCSNTGDSHQTHPTYSWEIMWIGDARAFKLFVYFLPIKLNILIKFTSCGATTSRPPSPGYTDFFNNVRTPLFRQKQIFNKAMEIFCRLLQLHASSGAYWRENIMYARRSLSRFNIYITN